MLVVAIGEKSPLTAWGLRAGDVIIAAADKPLKSPDALQTAYAAIPAGGKIPLTVIRRQKRLAVEMTGAASR